MTRNRWLPFLLLLALLPVTATACGTGEQTAEGYENAAVSHAHEHWQQGAYSSIPFVFIDVRTPEEYAAGHIPGARLIPLQELPERIAEVPTDKRVYVYCHSGRRSAKASALLAGKRLTNIENVVGGITAWQDAGYPVEK